MLVAEAMRLHVLTAVSRPENLPAIAESLAAAVANAPGVQVTWHWRFDIERENVGGQALKNAMLDGIDDGWCWVLDDDTLAHADALRVVRDVLHLGSRAFVVSQLRADGRVLVASPETMFPGSVDIGQAFLRRDLIGHNRIPLSYTGDGQFLQTVLERSTTTFLPDDVVSLHNVISGVEVSA